MPNAGMHMVHCETKAGRRNINRENNFPRGYFAGSCIGLILVTSTGGGTLMRISLTF